METISGNRRPSPLAWIGIACGGIILLVIIEIVTFSLVIDWKIERLSKDLQRSFGITAPAARGSFEENPTRATASVMVTTGQFEMVAEDDANKRYTVKQKKTGELMTIYWNERKKAPDTIPGDFSAIPPEPAAPAATATPAPK